MKSHSSNFYEKGVEIFPEVCQAEADYLFWQDVPQVNHLMGEAVLLNIALAVGLLWFQAEASKGLLHKEKECLMIDCGYATEVVACLDVVYSGI